MTSRRFLSFLKLVGIILFIWILGRIDREMLIMYLRKTDLILLTSIFPVLLLIYLLQAVRWQLLVGAVGQKPSLSDAWRVTNIGNFVASLTPGRIGDFSRALYLKNHSISKKMGLFVVAVDRAFVIGIILVLAIFASSILFDFDLLKHLLLLGGIGCIALWHILHFSRRLRKKFTILETLSSPLKPSIFIPAFFITLITWALYLGWAALVAKSVGIEVPVLPLVSALVVTWLVAILPLAPSGLGTREASLITLLAPYGITAEQSIALGLVMMVCVLLSCSLGGMYWVTHKS